MVIYKIVEVLYRANYISMSRINLVDSVFFARVVPFIVFVMRRHAFPSFTHVIRVSSNGRWSIAIMIRVTGMVAREAIKLCT